MQNPVTRQNRCTLEFFAPSFYPETSRSHKFATSKGEGVGESQPQSMAINLKQCESCS
jgi:hypothetical protein